LIFQLGILGFLTFLAVFQLGCDDHTLKAFILIDYSPTVTVETDMKASENCNIWNISDQKKYRRATPGGVSQSIKNVTSISLMHLMTIIILLTFTKALFYLVQS